MPRRASLLVIFLTVFIDLLGFGIVLPLLPIYGRELARQLELDAQHVAVGGIVALLMSSFSIMQFLFSPVWGRLSDRIGRRPVLLIGLGGSVIFYALFGVATILNSLPLLFIARIGAGIAGATIATAQAYIADCTTAENRARGMALIGAAFGLGFTFGPLFGYLAVSGDATTVGPGPGYAASALSAVAWLLAWFRLPESLEPGKSPPSDRSWFAWKAAREAWQTPSVGALLATLFVCVFSFANFESTLSLLVKNEEGPFRFTLREVCLTFSYIGLLLLIVQGGLVRRLSRRVPETTLAGLGAMLEIVGFGALAWTSAAPSMAGLLISLAVIVSGFAFLTPSLNSLISRRSDPRRQGAVLGVAQSISSLARIAGPLVGIPLHQLHGALPLGIAAVLMSGGWLMIVYAARHGGDFVAADEPAPADALNPS